MINRRIAAVMALLALAGCGGDGERDGATAQNETAGRDVSNQRLDRIAAVARFVAPANWAVVEAPMRGGLGTVLISGTGPGQRLLILSPTQGYTAVIGDVSCRLHAYSVSESRRARRDDRPPTMPGEKADTAVDVNSQIVRLCDKDPTLPRINGVAMEAVVRARQMAMELRNPPSGPPAPIPTQRVQKMIIAPGARAPAKLPPGSVLVDHKGVPIGKAQ